MTTIDIPTAIANAATAKSALDTATHAKQIADLAWDRTLHVLKLKSMPVAANLHARAVAAADLAKFVEDTKPTTASLPALADAKIATDAAHATAKMAHVHAQTALDAAMKAAGAR